MRLSRELIKRLRELLGACPGAQKLLTDFDAEIVHSFRRQVNEYCMSPAEADKAIEQYLKTGDI